jgi:hypothetical protein
MDISYGQTIYLLPGNHDISAGLVLPSNISIRGASVQTCKIQLAATADTTLLTMGEQTRVEDVTLNLTSSQNHNLKGVVFGGTTTETAKLRTMVINVDNAASTGTSNVYGVECLGPQGSLGPGSFSFNSLKGLTINVKSNGSGNKRGILVSGSNIVTSRDVNIYVAAPRQSTSTGSYVGVETNDVSNVGSAQLRSTTIGTVGGVTYSSSDILQTTPAVITNPTYLASPGIQVGPGTDLITKTAGGKGFSTYVYPTVLFYGFKGPIKSGASTNGYLWYGTQASNQALFPDVTMPPAYFRVQQPSLLSGLSASLNKGPGAGHDVALLVQYTKAGTTLPLYDTSFSITMTNGTMEASVYNSSVSLNTGDKIHLNISYTGGNGNTAEDLTAQIDLY